VPAEGAVAPAGVVLDDWSALEPTVEVPVGLVVVSAGVVVVSVGVVVVAVVVVVVSVGVVVVAVGVVVVPVGVVVVPVGVVEVVVLGVVEVPVVDVEVEVSVVVDVVAESEGVEVEVEAVDASAGVEDMAVVLAEPVEVPDPPGCVDVDVAEAAVGCVVGVIATVVGGVEATGGAAGVGVGGSTVVTVVVSVRPWAGAV
jgi:hypothetical protein